jgi:hypothetical protein
MKLLNLIIILCVSVILVSFSSKDEAVLLDGILSERPTRKDVRNSLGDLKNDTLYVINRMCSDKISSNDLHEIFVKNYWFSEFKIVPDSLVYKVSKQKNVVHYAVVGQYYTDKGSPVTNGVYLLDNKSELCVTPYPYHTRLWWFAYFSSKCLEKESHVEQLIAAFNSKLELAAKSINL